MNQCNYEYNNYKYNYNYFSHVFLLCSYESSFSLCNIYRMTARKAVVRILPGHLFHYPKNPALSGNNLPYPITYQSHPGRTTKIGKQLLSTGKPVKYNRISEKKRFSEKGEELKLYCNWIRTADRRMIELLSRIGISTYFSEISWHFIFCLIIYYFKKGRVEEKLVDDESFSWSGSWKRGSG